MTTSIFMLKYRAYAAIDAAAGDVRTQFITDVAGQQAVYLEKRTEAAVYVAAHTADPVHAVPGPHIAAEAAATAATPLDTANGILAEAALWLGTLSPAIEAARVGGKYLVGLCSTPEEIEAQKTAAITSIYALGATS